MALDQWSVLKGKYMMYDIFGSSLLGDVVNNVYDALIIMILVYIFLLYIDYLKTNLNHYISYLIFLIFFTIHLILLFNDFYYVYYILYAFYYFLALFIIFIISMIIELIRKKKIKVEIKKGTIKSKILSGVVVALIIILGILLICRMPLYEHIDTYRIKNAEKQYEIEQENIYKKVRDLYLNNEYEELIEYCKKNNEKDYLALAYEELYEKYLSEKEYEKAYNVYYDSVIKNKEANFSIGNEFPINEKRKYIKEGDSIVFGGIGMTEYGLEVGRFPIKWYFLKSEEGRKYFISNYILLTKEFDEKGSTNFSESSLRKFLNKYFYENVFSDSEKELLYADDYGDNVFLVEEDDIIDNELEFINTAYALQGKYKNSFWIKPKADNVVKVYDYNLKIVETADPKDFLIGVVPVICFK